MKKVISDLLIWSGIYAIVTFSWQGLELFFIGKINPNFIDTIVGIVLSYSLFGNFKNMVIK